MYLSNEAEILDAANDSWPREACGLVYGDVAYLLPNVAKSDKFFIMDFDAQAELIRREKRAPDAVWHSHPNDDPTPSEADIRHHPAGVRMLIVADGKVHDHGYPAGS